MIENRDTVVPGVTLVGKYKGTEHRAEVVDGDEAGRIKVRPPDGREFKSLSSAAMALMNGIAVNGWAFWKLDRETEIAALVAETHKEAASKQPTTSKSTGSKGRAAAAKKAS